MAVKLLGTMKSIWADIFFLRALVGHVRFGVDTVKC